MNYTDNLRILRAPHKKSDILDLNRRLDNGCAAWERYLEKRALKLEIPATPFIKRTIHERQRQRKIQEFEAMEKQRIANENKIQALQAARRNRRSAQYTLSEMGEENMVQVPHAGQRGRRNAIYSLPAPEDIEELSRQLSEETREGSSSSGSTNSSMPRTPIITAMSGSCDYNNISI